MLREERERQGLSIETVSDMIKITRSCLTAIEEGNENNLPHPVYAKGFIKNYAKLLGVDQEDFSKRLSEVYRPEEPSLGDAQILQGVSDDDCDCTPKASSKFPLVPIIVVAVIVLLVAGLGWYLYAHVLSKPATETEAPAPKAAVEPAPAPQPEPQRPVPTVPMAKPAEPVAPPAAQQTSPTPQQFPAVADTLPPATPMPAPTPDDQATQDIANSGPANGISPAPIPPAPAPVPGAPAAPALSVGENGTHTVVITANERCWVQAGADGGPMHEAMLEKGDVFNGRFNDNLLVRLGNAGAVEIRFDNKLYPLQAGKGSVKTLKFVAKKSEGEPAKTPPKAETPPPAVPTAQTAAPVAGQPTASAAEQPAAGDATAAKEVEVYGQDGSWVIVNPDKGPAKEIYVKKGQRITVPFSDKVEIRLGNPSSVVFRYGGKETAVTTDKGESKSIRFP